VAGEEGLLGWCHQRHGRDDHGAGLHRRFIPAATNLDATVISTAGEAALSVADPSSTNTGELVNGSFALQQTLQAGTGRHLRADLRHRCATVQ
jgi:hypothetical protein